MATRNFPFVNTSKYFTFGFCEDENVPQETIDFAVEDTIRWAAEKLETEHNWESYAEMCGSHFEDAIADKCVTFKLDGIEFYLEISAFVELGYYGGACFNLRARLTCEDYNEYNLFDGANFDDNGETFEVANYTEGEGWEYTDKTVRGLNSKVKQELSKLQKEAEQVFSEVCHTTLMCVGTYSNGEAIYVAID